MTDQASRGSIPTITANEAARRQTEPAGALLVDVRELDEYIGVRATDSAFLPMSQLAFRHADLPKDRPLMLICQSGVRSGRATAFLLQQGFADVSNVEGGMLAWAHAELPTRRGPLDPGEGEL